MSTVVCPGHGLTYSFFFSGITDYLSGGSLHFQLNAIDQNKDGLRDEVVAVVTAELATAVDHLHRLQIIHGDIKPANVALDA